MITTEIVRDVETFKKLRNEWTDLLNASSSDGLFMTWEWMYSWWMHLSEDRTLHIILVRNEGQLLALAPLALCPSRYLPFMPFRMLEFLASDCVGSDYLSILVRKSYEAQALDVIASSLTESGHVVEFVRVEKSSFLMVNMALHLRFTGWKSISSTTNYCPYTKLSNHSWESYLATLHRSHRQDLAKKIRKLYKTFSVEFLTVATESEREVAMSTFVRLHLHRWEKQGGSTALGKKELLAFHTDISKNALENGWLRLHTLLLDGNPVASIYLFNYQGACYYYQAAFHPDFAKYSVGMVTLALGIKHAISEGADEFDFLHDDEEYKYLWSRFERELIRIELFPPRSTGIICQQAVVVKGGIKRLFGNLSRPGKVFGQLPTGEQT